LAFSSAMNSFLAGCRAGKCGVSEAYRRIRAVLMTCESEEGGARGSRYV
jgi:hypothetical protein